MEKQVNKAYENMSSKVISDKDCKQIILYEIATKYQ